MRKLPIFLVSLLLSAGTTTAQDYAQEPVPPPAPNGKRDPRPLKDRLYFGGGVNLSFGTVSNLGVSPMVGYKIDQKGKWSAGLIVNYNYFSDNRSTPKYESSTYGGSLFTRYRVIPQLYLHAEYSQQNYELYSLISDQGSRVWVPFLLLGGGYAQPVGGNSFITFQVLWDVIQDPRSPFGNQPWITGGIGVGF